MRGAHPEREVERTLERSDVVAGGERVLIACSGGPDSVALAAAMHGVAPRRQFSLHLGFVNHGTRASAWQDECIVLQLAADLALPLQIAVLEESGATEEALRVARYDALAEMAKRTGCSAVVTAHHAEDQSETVLLALLRGTGPVGLRGMEGRRSLTTAIDLARPLLKIPSERLRAYCHARALPYAVDPSNSQTTLRRNAVRDALAALRPLFPGLDAAVARAADVAAAEREDSPRARLRGAVREELRKETELRDIDFLHVEEAVRALENGRTGTFHMKAGVALRIEGGTITGITRRGTSGDGD
ncbi:MAG: tRNA lysidine(34) synthetase TilS [Candidatus Eremiobacteraeota bacterium]|nr:tRNA lysidine(34) synthetase TilS [Candidatus Eremiobacteraeota bacterium]